MSFFSHNRKCSTYTGGFTLVEILLALSIGAMTTFLTTKSFLYVMDARERSQARLELVDQGRFMLHTLTQAIRNADAIIAPGNSLTDNAVSLLMRDPSASPTTFTLADDALMMTEGLASAVALSGGQVAVTGFSIENGSIPGTPGIITIRLTLSYLSESIDPEILATASFRTSAAIRNTTP